MAHAATHTVSSPRSLCTLGVECSSSCARTAGCPAVYRVIVTLTPIAVEFAIDKAFEHHHLSRRSSRLPREVVSRISVLVGQCGVVKASQLRRFLGAEGLWDDAYGVEALRRHVRRHRAQLLRSGFTNTCAALRELVAQCSLRMKLSTCLASCAWDPAAAHIAGCLSGPEAVDDARGRVWISFSTLHFAFNYLRSLLLGLHFINADSTESVNCSRFPLLAGGVVGLSTLPSRTNVSCWLSARRAMQMISRHFGLMCSTSWLGICVPITTVSVPTTHTPCIKLRLRCGASWERPGHRGLRQH